MRVETVIVVINDSKDCMCGLDRDGLTNGPTGPRPRGPWAQGAPKPEPLREVAVMYFLFVVEKGVFSLFANGFNWVYLCCVRKKLY